MHIFVSEAHDTSRHNDTCLTSDNANGPVHSPCRVQRHLRHAFFSPTFTSSAVIQARSWLRIVIATRLIGVGLSSAQGIGADIGANIK